MIKIHITITCINAEYKDMIEYLNQLTGKAEIDQTGIVFRLNDKSVVVKNVELDYNSSNTASITGTVGEINDDIAIIIIQHILDYISNGKVEVTDENHVFYNRDHKIYMKKFGSPSSKFDRIVKERI